MLTYLIFDLMSAVGEHEHVEEGEETQEDVDEDGGAEAAVEDADDEPVRADDEDEENRDEDQAEGGHLHRPEVLDQCCHLQPHLPGLSQF